MPKQHVMFTAMQCMAPICWLVRCLRHGQDWLLRAGDERAQTPRGAVWIHVGRSIAVAIKASKRKKMAIRNSRRCRVLQYYDDRLGRLSLENAGGGWSDNDWRTNIENLQIRIKVLLCQRDFAGNVSIWRAIPTPPDSEGERPMNAANIGRYS